MTNALVWLRQDLRLEDNPALNFALSHATQVFALYIDDDSLAGNWAKGAATKAWLRHSLAQLETNLAKKNISLYYLKVTCFEELEASLQELIINNDLELICWNRQYAPWTIQRDTQLKSSLKTTFPKLQLKSFQGNLLNEPWTLLNKAGQPFKVFTPYYKTASALMPAKSETLTVIPTTQSKTTKLRPATKDFCSLEALAYQPQLDWDKQFDYQVGEGAAQQRLRQFLDQALVDYADNRDQLAKPEAVSQLSTALAIGEISPRYILTEVMDWQAHHPEQAAKAESFVRQLYWHDFAYACLYHFPKMTDNNFNTKFDAYPWITDTNHPNFVAWKQGKTGYPVIDAAMTELWQTGRMHNRARMLVASFLTKNLGIHWHLGAKVFWDRLLDADLANNSFGWQWTAGSGMDAAPYFRIFNPVTQGQKFDPQADYISQYLPQLTKLPIKYRHTPWELSQQQALAYGFKLGQDYPSPITDLKTSRAEALANYELVKNHSNPD